MHEWHSSTGPEAREIRSMSKLLDSHTSHFTPCEVHTKLIVEEAGTAPETVWMLQRTEMPALQKRLFIPGYCRKSNDSCVSTTTETPPHLQPASYLSLLADDGCVVIEPHIVKQNFEENVRDPNEIVVFLRLIEGIQAFLLDFNLETHQSNGNDTDGFTVLPSSSI
jgi:hypothetical protein